MIVKFEEKGHIYSVDGEIASISVTELLAKHGLTPYNGVKTAVMRSAAELGKRIHKDLENVLNAVKHEPKTVQGERFKEWVAANLDCGVGEQVIGYERDGMIIAGTADVIGINKDGELIIGDHKNTSQFHREYVTWQVSLLDYFLRKLHEKREELNGNRLNWKGAKRFYCFRYEPATGEMTVHSLNKISDTEIERLLECEYNGELYTRKELAIDDELRDKYLAAEERFAEIETAAKAAERERDELRAELLKLFKAQGIQSWESPTGKFLITYCYPTDRISVDSKKLKEKYPTVYSECQKISTVKEYLRVTIRSDEE